MYDIIYINMKGEWRCVTRIPANEVDWFVKCVDEISNYYQVIQIPGWLA